MAVYSMTGYASAQLDASTQGSDSEVRTPAARQLGLEIRSVNSRFLDLSFRLPDELRAMEPVLRTLLTKKIKRGKVDERAAGQPAFCSASMACKTTCKRGCPTRGRCQ